MLIHLSNNLYRIRYSPIDEYIQQLWTLLYLEDIVCMVYTYFKVNDFRYYTQDLILTKDKAQSDVFLCQHFNVSQMAIYIQIHWHGTSIQPGLINPWIQSVLDKNIC
jgi:hypothetical protein